MPDFLVGFIRTVVPWVVGYLLSIPLVVRVFDLLGVSQADRNDWTARGLTVVIAALYYLVARFLEQHKAVFGWLLGIAKQPQYVAVMNDITAGHDPQIPADDGPTVVDATSPQN